MSYRRDPEAQAAADGLGCLIALFAAVFVGLFYILAEILRYQPKPYAPASPYHPTHRGVPVTMKPPRLLSYELMKWGMLLGFSIVVVVISPAAIRDMSAYFEMINTILPVGVLWATLFAVVGFFGLGFEILATLAFINFGAFIYRFWRNPPETQGEWYEALRDEGDTQYFWRYLNISLLRLSLKIALGIALPYCLLTAYTISQSVIAVSAEGKLTIEPDVVSGKGNFLSFLVAMGFIVMGCIFTWGAWWFLRNKIANIRGIQEEEAQLKQRREAYRQAEALAAPQPTIYSIYVPRTPPDYITGSKLMQALLSVAPRLTFQIVGTAEQIVWQIVDKHSQYNPKKIESHIKSHLPEAAVVIESEDELTVGAAMSYPFYRKYLLFQLRQEFGVPMPSLEQLKDFDPLFSLSNRLHELRLGERIVYSVVVLAATPQARTRAIERFRGNYIVSETNVRPEQENEQPRLEFDEKLVTAKLSGQLYHCYVVVSLESRHANRLDHLSQIATDVTQYQQPGHNGLNHHLHVSHTHIQNAKLDDQKNFEAILEWWVTENKEYWRTSLLVLSPQEIAALWHLPNEDFVSRKIFWTGKPAPVELTQAAGERLILGSVSVPGEHGQVGIQIVDRSTHHYILGKTGVGKSTLMHNLIMQDIRAGRGVAVIDPHGKLIKWVLDSLDTRHDEVVLLECGKTKYPVPLNPFRVPKGLTFDDARESILWALLKIYEEIKEYARLKMLLGYVIEALLCDPNATPLDIKRLLTDVTYRAHVLQLMKKNKHTTIAAWDYLNSLDNKSYSRRDEIIDPVINRTGVFLGNRALESMTCHPSSLNYAQLIKSRAIVLIDLSGSSIEAEVGSLATLFMAGFFRASKILGEIPEGAPPRYYVYIDEIERVATHAFKELLAQVRKLGLSLVLAHQHFSQLSAEVKEAIVGNVGTYTIFEIGSDDARELAPYFEPEVKKDELVKLGKYRAAVKTRYHEKTLPGFILNTLPPVPAAEIHLLPWSGVIDTEWIRSHSHKTQQMILETLVRAALEKRYRGNELDTDDTQAALRQPDKATKPTPPAKPRRKTAVKDFE